MACRKFLILDCPRLRRILDCPRLRRLRSPRLRIVGSVEAMVEKAKAIDQEWMKRIGYARWLAKTR